MPRPMFLPRAVLLTFQNTGTPRCISLQVLSLHSHGSFDSTNMWDLTQDGESGVMLCIDLA